MHQGSVTNQLQQTVNRRRGIDSRFRVQSPPPATIRTLEEPSSATEAPCPSHARDMLCGRKAKQFFASRTSSSSEEEGQSQSVVRGVVVARVLCPRRQSSSTSTSMGIGSPLVRKIAPRNWAQTSALGRPLPNHLPRINLASLDEQKLMPNREKVVLCTCGYQCANSYVESQVCII